MKPYEEKAIRLVAEKRVHVLWANADAGHGLVDGDTHTYRCSYSPEGYVCTCPAGRYRNCSHALALRLMIEAGESLQLELATV